MESIERFAEVARGFIATDDGKVSLAWAVICFGGLILLVVAIWLMSKIEHCEECGHIVRVISNPKNDRRMCQRCGADLGPGLKGSLFRGEY